MSKYLEFDKPISLLQKNSHQSSYIVGQKIGEGGRAHVFLGMHTRSSRKVALKYSNQVQENNPLLQKEFQLLQLLANDHIPEAIDYFDDVTLPAKNTPTYCLVMQHIFCNTLEQKITMESNKDSVSLPIGDILCILLQAANTLEYAYEYYQTLHRDLKPDNLLVKPNNHTYLADWGLATHVYKPSNKLGSITGDMKYLPPEVINDHVNNTLQGHVYALACIFQECLTGRLPHEIHLGKEQMDDGEAILTAKIMEENESLNHQQNLIDLLGQGIVHKLASVQSHALNIKSSQRNASPSQYINSLTKIFHLYSTREIFRQRVHLSPSL